MRMRSVSLCYYDIWHSCRQPPWLSFWESQVPRVMHYTERCIEVRPCYLFDKLEFIEEHPLIATSHYGYFLQLHQ